jgi:hypothetical protein
MTLLHSNQVKYRVLVDGKVLNESATKTLADVFFESLDENVKRRAQVVPVMEDGRQLLNG